MTSIHILSQKVFSDHPNTTLVIVNPRLERCSTDQISEPKLMAVQISIN